MSKNKKCVSVISFSTDEIIGILLIAAHKQGRIPDTLWKEMVDKDENVKFNYTITHQPNFGSKLELFKAE